MSESNQQNDGKKLLQSFSAKKKSRVGIRLSPVPSESPLKMEAISDGQQVASQYSAAKNKDRVEKGNTTPLYYTATSTPLDDNMTVSDMLQKAIFDLSSDEGESVQQPHSSHKKASEVVNMLQQIQQRVDEEQNSYGGAEAISPHRRIQFASPTGTPSSDLKMMNSNSKRVSALGDRNSTLEQYMSNQLDLNAKDAQETADNFEALLSMVEQKDGELQTVQAELETTKEELVHAKQELAQYMNNQLDLQNSEIKDYEEKFEALMATIEEKDDELLSNSLAIQEEEDKVKELSGMNESYRNQIETLQASVDELNKDILDLKATIAAKDSELSDIRTSHSQIVEDLKWEIADSRAEIDSLNERIEKQVFQSENDMRLAEETIEELKEKLVTAANEKTNVERSNEELQSSLAESKQQVDELTGDLSAVQDSVAGYLTQVDMLTSNLEEKSVELENMATVNKQSADELAAIKVELNEQAVSFANLEAKYIVAETQLVNSKLQIGQAKEEAEKLQAEFDKSSAVLESQQSEIAALKQELQSKDVDLQQALDVISQLKLTEDSLRSDITGLHENIEELRASYAAAAMTADDNAAELGDRICQLEADIVRCQEEALKKHSEELEAMAVSKKKEIQNVTEFYQQQLSQAQSNSEAQHFELERLQGLLSNAPDTKATAESISQLNEKISHFELREIEAASLKKRLNSELQTVQAELETTKEELVHAKQELAQYMNNQLDLQNSEIKEYEEKLASLMATIEEKDDELLSNSLAIQEEEDKVKELSGRIDVLSRSVDEKDKKILDLEATSSQILLERNETVSELEEQLRNAHSSAGADIDGSEEDLKRVIADMKWEIDDYKNQVDELNEQLESNRLSAGDNASNGETILQLQNQIESLEDEIISFTARLQARDEEHNSLLVERNSLVDRLEVSESVVQSNVLLMEKYKEESLAMTSIIREKDEELAVMQGKVKLLQSEVEAQSTSYSNLEAKFADSAAEAAIQEELVSEYKDRISALTEELNIAKTTARSPVKSLSSPSTPMRSHPPSAQKPIMTPGVEIRKLQRILESATPRKTPSSISRNPFDNSNAGSAKSSPTRGMTNNSNREVLDVYMNNQLELNESESAYYSEVIDQLVAQMEDLQENVSKLTAENSKLEVLVKENVAKGPSSVPSSPLVAAESKMKDQAVLITQLESEKSAAEMKAQEMEELYNQLEASLAENQRQLMDIENDLKQYKEDNTALEETVRVLKEDQGVSGDGDAAIDELKSQISELKEVNNELQSANSEWNEYYANTQIELEDGAKALAAKEADFNDVSKMYEELLVKYESVSEDSASLVKTVAKLEELEALVLDKDAQISELTNSLNAVRTTTVADSVNSSGLDSANASFDLLGSTTAAAADAGEELNALRIDCNASAQKISTLEADVSALEQQVAELSDANAQYESEYQSLVAENQALVSAAESGDLKEQLNASQEKVAGLEADVSALEQQVAELSDANAQYESEYQSLVAENQALVSAAESGDLTLLQEQLNASQEKVAGLEADLSALEQHVAELSSANAEYESEYKNVVSQNDELVAANASLKAECEKLAVVNEKISSDERKDRSRSNMDDSFFSPYQTKLSIMENTNEELKLSLSIAERGRDDALLDAEQLRNRLAAKDVRMNKLLEQLEEQQKQHRLDEMSVLESAQSAISLDYSENNTESSEHTNQLFAHAEYISQLEAENNDLKVALDERLDELNMEVEKNTYLRQVVENIGASEESAVQMQLEKESLAAELAQSNEQLKKEAESVSMYKERLEQLSADYEYRIASSKSVVATYETRVSELEEQLQNYQCQLRDVLNGSSSDGNTSGDGLDVINQLNSKMESIISEKCAVEKHCHEYRLEIQNLEQLHESSQTSVVGLEKNLKTLAQYVLLVHNSITKQQDSLHRQYDIWMNKYDERLHACKRNITVAVEQRNAEISLHSNDIAELKEQLLVYASENDRLVAEKDGAIASLRQSESVVSQLEEAIHQFQSHPAETSLYDSPTSSKSNSAIKAYAERVEEEDESYESRIVNGELFSSPNRSLNHSMDVSSSAGSRSANPLVRSLKDKLESSERRFNELSVENARKYAAATHHVASLEGENKHLTELTSDLKSTNSAYLVELQSLRETVSEGVKFKSSYEALLVVEMELRDKISELESDFAEKEAVLIAANQQSQVESAKTKQSLDFKIQELQMQIQSLEQLAQNSGSESESMQAQLADSQAFYSKLVQDKDDQLRLVSDNNSQLKSLLNEKDAEVVSGRNKIFEVESKLNSLQLQYASLVAEHTESENNHKQELLLLAQEHELKLKESLSSIENTVIAQLKLKLSHIEHEKHLLDQQYATQSQEAFQYMEDYNDIKKQFVQLQDVEQQLSVKLREVTKECETVKTEFSEFQSSTYSDVCNELMEYKLKISSLTVELESNESSHVSKYDRMVKAFEDQIDSLTTDLETVRGELLYSKEVHKEMNDNICRLEEKEALMIETVSSLEGRLQDYEHRDTLNNDVIEDSKKEIDASKNRIAELELLLQKNSLTLSDITAESNGLLGDMRDVMVKLSSSASLLNSETPEYSHNLRNDLFASPIPPQMQHESDCNSSSILEDEAVLIRVDNLVESRKLFANMRLSIESLVSGFSSVSKKYSVSADELQHVREQMKIAQQKIVDLTEEGASLKTKCDELDNALSSGHRKIADYAREVSDNKEHLDKLHRNILESVQDMIDSACDCVASMNSELSAAGLTSSGHSVVEKIPLFDMQGLIIHGSETSAVDTHDRVVDFKCHLMELMQSIGSTVGKLAGETHLKVTSYNRLQTQYKEAVEALKDTNSDVTSKYSTAQETLTHANEKVKALSLEVEELQTENRKLQLVCNDFSNNNAELQNELARAVDGNAELKYSIEDADNVCRNLKQHIEMLQDEISNKTREITSHKTTVNTLQSQVYEKDTEVEKYSIVTKRLEAERDMLQASNKKLMADVEQQRKDFHAKNRVILEENNKMKLEVDKILHSINLTVEYYKISSAVSPLKSNGKTDGVLDKFDAIHSNMSAIQANNKELVNNKYALENKTKLQDQEIENLRKKITAIVNEQHVSNNLVISELKKQVSDLQSQVLEYSNEVQVLTNQNNELAQSLQSLKQSEASNSNKSTLAIQNKDNEISRLKKDLESKIKSVEMLREQVVQLNDRTKSFMSANEGFQQKISMLETGNEHAKEKIGELEQRYELEKSNHVALKRKYEADVTDVKENIVAKSLAEKREFTAQLDSMKQEVVTVKKELSAQQQLVLILNKEKEKTQLSLSTLQSQVRQLSNTNESLTEEVSREKVKYQNVVRQHDEQVTIRKQLESSLQQQTAALTVLRRSGEGSSSKVSEASQQIVSKLNATIKDLQEQLKLANASNNGDKTDTDALHSELQHTKEQLSIANQKASDFRREGRAARQAVHDVTDKLREYVNIVRSHVNPSLGMALVTPSHRSGGSTQSLYEALGLVELETVVVAVDSMLPYIVGHFEKNKNNNNLKTPSKYGSGSGEALNTQKLENEIAHVTRVLADMEANYNKDMSKAKKEKALVEDKLIQCQRELSAVNIKHSKSSSEIKQLQDSCRKEKNDKQLLLSEQSELHRKIKALENDCAEFKAKCSEYQSVSKDKELLLIENKKLEKEAATVTQELLASNHHRNILKNTIEKLEIIVKKKDYGEFKHSTSNASEESLALQDISIVDASVNDSTNSDARVSGALPLKKQLLACKGKIKQLEDIVELYHDSVVALYPNGNTYGAAQHNKLGDTSINKLGNDWIEEQINVIKQSFVSELKYYEMEVEELRTRYNSEVSYNNEMRKQFQANVRDMYNSSSRRGSNSTAEKSHLDVLSSMLDKNEVKITDLMTTLTVERNNNRHRHSQLIHELSKALQQRDQSITAVKQLEELCKQSGVNHVVVSSQYMRSGSRYGTPVRGSAPPSAVNSPLPLPPRSPSSYSVANRYIKRESDAHIKTVGMNFEEGRGSLSKTVPLPTHDPSKDAKVNVTTTPKSNVLSSGATRIPPSGENVVSRPTPRRPPNASPSPSGQLGESRAVPVSAVNSGSGVLRAVKGELKPEK